MDHGIKSKNKSSVFGRTWTITVMILITTAGFSVLVKVPENTEAERSGPDYYGYRWTDSNLPEPTISYNWIEISGTGTSVGPLGDEDNYGPFNLGFTFDFYGNSYTEVWINNNGFIMFTNQTGVFAGNNPIPDSANPNNIIAPFWDDLSTAGNIYYKQEGIGPNRYFIVEWKDVENYNIPGVGSVTFEAIMYEGSNSINYQYQDVVFGHEDYDYGNSSTVGIENITGTGGLQYSYNNATLSDSLAIQIMRYPVHYIIINNTAGPGGSWVGDRNYTGGDTDTFYAHGFNELIGYLGDVPVTWTSSNTSVGTVTSPGSSTTFQAGGEGTCIVTATYNSTISNDTGVFTVKVAPEIENVMFLPSNPNGTTLVSVYADITDDNGIQNATLYYSYDGIFYTPVDMNLVGGDTYSGSIPGPGFTTMVYYYVNATDNKNNTNMSSIYSYLADADLPEFGMPRTNPDYPGSTEAVDITVDIFDDYQISDANLIYSYDGSTWNGLPMSELGGETFYINNVEADPSGWTHYPLSGPAGDNWDISTILRTSIPYSWYSGQEPSAYWGDCCLESPLFTNLPPSTNLTFWCWYRFYQNSPVDGGIVEINDGGGWTQVFPIGGYDGTLLTGFMNPLENLEAFTQYSSGWEQKRVDLSSYVGKDIRIRFRVGWNNIDEGPTEGWFIDDILLHSDDPGWRAQIPSPGFPTTVYYYINATDNAGNLNTTTTYSYSAGSDLVLASEDIILRPLPLENGSLLSIEANILNNGGSLQNVEVKFFLGDPDTDDDNIIDGGAQEIGTSDIIDFDRNSKNKASTSWSPPDIGSYDIYVWVDAQNGSWEFDEWNNLAFQTLPVFHWADSFDDLTKTDYQENITYYEGDATIGGDYRYNFDTSDEGFILESDEPASQVYWDSINKNVYFLANSSDNNDEIYSKSILGPIDENTGSWTLSGRVMITVRGIWQNTIFLFMANSGNTEILNTPNTVSFEYSSTGNAIRGVYTDSTGKERLVISQHIILNTEYHVMVKYDKTTMKLTLFILDDMDVILTQGSYVIGTNLSDGFTFGKIGVGTNGSSKSPYDVCTGWTDDINLSLIGSIYDKGALFSIPLSPPSDGQWVALYVNKTEPSNTYINVTLIDAISGDPIPGFVNLREEYIDITGIDAGVYPSIKLVADFVCLGTDIPKLHYWGINTQVFQFSIQLYEGWNMISIPINKSTTDLVTIFATVNFVAVQWYDAFDGNDPWKHYHEDKTSLNDLTDVDKTMGLWVYMASNDNLTISGTPSIHTEIQLKEGWNFVGYPSLAPRLITDSLSGIPYDVVEHYNTSNPGDKWESTQLGTLTWMNPGEGYWIHVLSDCTWIVNW